MGIVSNMGLQVGLSRWAISGVTVLAGLSTFSLHSIARAQPLQEPSDGQVPGSLVIQEEVLPEEAIAVPTAPPLTLEKPNQDPLLPGRVNGRALSPTEQRRLRLGLERLTEEANAAYAKGDRANAYSDYFHILGLAQYLPMNEELTALADVGDRAWRDSRSKATQLITERLTALAAQAGDKLPNSNRLLLAEAYERSGAWTQSIAQYEAVLSGQQPDGEKSVSGEHSSSALEPVLPEPALVNRLARLNLLRLNYPAAVTYTEQALAFAKAAGASSAAPGMSEAAEPDVSSSSAASSETPVASPLPSESDGSELSSRGLLIQLAYLYEQEQRFAEAAAVQQQLVPLYDNSLELRQQPALQVSIARNQAQAGLLTEAIDSYQLAYRQAQTLQQFAVSHDALSQLGALYRRQAQLDDALAVYDVLLQVDELSYNLYDLTDTHVSRAEVFLEQGFSEQARRAYSHALHSAKLLSYRVEELEQKLAELQ